MTTVLRSQDLTCPSCARAVEAVLRKLDGVEGASVHVSTGRIEVRHDPRRASAADLVAALRAIGYQARPGAF